MAVLNPNCPLIYDQFATNLGAADNTTVATWVDLTSRVSDRTFTAGEDYELGHIAAGVAAYTVDNRDETLNPANPASPYAGKLLPYRRIRTLGMWGLTGNILNSGQDTAGTLTTSWPDTSTFEGGTGGWSQGGSAVPALATDATHVWQGTKALRLTWPTAAGGRAVTQIFSPSFTGSWGLAGGVTYTWSVYVWVEAGSPAVAIGVSPFVGGPVPTGHTQTTTTGAWERLSGTFVCNDPSRNALVLYPVAATAAQHVWVDAVQLEAADTASAFTTTGPLIQPLFAGYIERYPIRWESQGTYGWTDLEAVDELALLAQTTFVDAVRSVRLTNSPAPVLCYPLTEASGSSSAGNVAATQQPAAAALQVGAGGAVAFGTDAGPNGVGTSVASFAPASVTAGVCLGATLSATLSGDISANVTLMAWFRTTTTPSTPAVVAALWDGVTDYVELVIGTDGGLYCRAVLNTGGGDVAVPIGVTGPYTDGNWHHAAVTVAFAQPSTFTVYVDGASVGSGTLTLGSGVKASKVYIGGSPKGRMFTGDVCYVTAYTAVVPATGDFWHSGADGFAGDYGYQRLNRIMTWYGHTLTYLTHSGSQFQGTQVHNGRTVQQIALDVSDTDGGKLWVPSQALYYADRSLRFNRSTPLFVLGENSAGGEIPYEENITQSTDPDFLYNDVTVDRVNGATVRVVDAVSQAAYTPRAYSVTVYSTSDGDATDHANYVLYRYAQPGNRISAVAVESRGKPNTFTTMLQQLLSQRVTLKRRLSNGQTVTADYFVESVRRRITEAEFTTTLSLSPAANSTFFTLGDATNGLIGTGVLGW